MRKALLIVAMLLLVTPVMATTTITVNVNPADQHPATPPDGNVVQPVTVSYVTDVNVRAFALDINIDNTNGKPNFQGIRNFKTGESTAASRGYGIFPARFRDFVDATNPDPCYALSTYNPTTSNEPDSANTGMGYPKMIIEMGTLYASDANKPAWSATLFTFDVNNCGATGIFHITVGADTLRGGVVDANGSGITANYEGNNVNFACTVPNVVNEAEAAATADIINAGFALGNRTTTCSNSIASGNVISTNPAANSPATCGTTVDYVISTGSCCVTIFNEVGTAEATATAAWAGQGFTIGTRTADVNCAQVNNITSQDSTGCIALPHTVNYHYGTQANEPNIVGKTMSDANATIIAAGLTVGTITYEPNGLKTALTVDRQSPPAGTVTCSAVSYVVDTNCLYVGRVFSTYGTNTFTVTSAMVGYWNNLGRPNCWCCASQKRGNGIYTGGSAGKTDISDLAAVKNTNNYGKGDTTSNACLDFNLSNKIDITDLAICKNTNNYGKATGSGPPCQ